MRRLNFVCSKSLHSNINCANHRQHFYYSSFTRISENLFLQWNVTNSAQLMATANVVTPSHNPNSCYGMLVLPSKREIERASGKQKKHNTSECWTRLVRSPITACSRWHPHCPKMKTASKSQACSFLQHKTFSMGENMLAASDVARFYSGHRRYLLSKIPAKN